MRRGATNCTCRCWDRTPCCCPTLWVFSLNSKNISRLIEQKELGLNPADVQGLYLNIRYDGTHLTCVTGTSFKSFMMDKTLEREWDEMVKKFFLKKEIEFELM